MTVSKENQTPDDSEERLFIEKALASVENARRFQRIKQIAVTALAFMAAFWLIAFKGPGPQLQVECTVIIVVGLALSVCTAKITSLINKNTGLILRTIADRRREEGSGGHG